MQVGPDGHPIGPDGHTLVLSHEGATIAIGPDGHAIIGPDGQPVLIGPDGHPIGSDGHPLAIGPDGQPIALGHDGHPLDMELRQEMQQHYIEQQQQQIQSLQASTPGNLNPEP